MEGRRKEVVLLIVAACALAVALITFLGRSGPPPPPPAAPVAPAPSDGDEGNGGDEQPGSKTGSGEEDTSRNPFTAPDAVPADPAGESDVGSGPETDIEGQVPVATSLTLTGIIAGRPSIACIREDGQRYYVSVGEQIGERYRVQQIGRGQVILTGQEGRVILRMGGRQ
jgi:hypothetical protein